MIPAEIAALTKSVRLTGQLTQRYKLSNNNVKNNDNTNKNNYNNCSQHFIENCKSSYIIVSTELPPFLLFIFIWKYEYIFRLNPEEHYLRLMNQLGGSTKPATLDNLSIILSKVRTKPATLDNLSIILSKVRTKPATIR